MAGIALSGLASGLDSQTLIAQLMSLREAPIARANQKINTIQARETALNDVKTRLNNLMSAAKDLQSPTLWKDTQTVESSDATKISARLLSPTGTGAYAVEVSQLARSAQRTAAYAPPAADTTVTLQSDSGDPVSISIGAGASIQEAADAFNSSSTSPVYAVAVGDKLIFSSRASGAANGFTVLDGGGALTEDATRAVAGLDARYTVNGDPTVRTSASNVLTDAIPGVELTLKTTTPPGSPLVVNVSAPTADTAATQAKVQAFVDQYNSTIDFVQSKLTEKRVPDATTQSDRNKGVLFGDTALSGLLNSMRQTISQTFGDLGNPDTRDSLAEIGISTGAGTGGASTATSLAGKLSLDTAKLTTALADGRFDVKRLLSGEGTTGGFAQALTGLIEPYTKTDGVIAGRVGSGTSEMTRLRDSITKMSERNSLEEGRLKAQFAALEKALSSSQSQQSWLSGQISSLNR